MTSELTFKDFAAAIMSQDVGRASDILEALLGLDAAGAREAAEHFQSRMAEGPEFLMKAMGMRQVVQSGDDATLGQLLGDVFGLTGAAQTSALASIRERFK